LFERERDETQRLLSLPCARARRRKQVIQNQKGPKTFAEVAV
jgi:hypothetical protein